MKGNNRNTKHTEIYGLNLLMKILLCGYIRPQLLVIWRSQMYWPLMHTSLYPHFT